MIQRPQTLCLLGVITCFIASFFFPIWTAGSEGYAFVLNTFSFSGPDVEQNTWYISAACILISAIALFSIFSFKNRKLQIRLGMLNSLLITLYMVLMFTVIVPGCREYATLKLNGSYGVGMYLPILALLFNIAANILVKRDEKLVRSMDRFR